MILDSKRYRTNISFITFLTKDKTLEERVEMISHLAVSTGVPVAIVITYLIELYGESKELLDYLEGIKKFYRIKEIL